jgi:hypothetical protein
VHCDCARYELLEGEPLEIVHHGETITVTASSQQSRALPVAPQPAEPQPPPGRRSMLNGRRPVESIADGVGASRVPTPLIRGGSAARGRRD